MLNVTVANPGAPGYLTAYPQGGSPPTASNLDYGAGQVTANRVIVPLSAGGGYHGLQLGASRCDRRRLGVLLRTCDQRHRVAIQR